MPLHLTLFLLAGLLILALLLNPLAERLRLPFAVLLIAAGFAGSELLVGLGLDTGLRADSFHDLIFYVFLPVLIFESAFKIDTRMLLRNLLPILIVAIPVMLFSTLITAVLVYYGIGHPSGFPWIAALLTGALLSATDPVAVVELFRKLGAPERLCVVMEGESLFNDATAIVVFGIFLYLAMNPQEQVDIADAALRFLTLFFGGLLVGLFVGLAFWLLSRAFADELALQGLITLLSAYVAYLTAEVVLHLSGVMAVLVTALVMGRIIRRDYPPECGLFVNQFWTLNAFLANSLVFLLMGATITLPMFQERWLAMSIGIASVLLARAAGLFGSLPLVSLLPGVERIPFGYQRVMVWGGVRGAVTIALALSLPLELDYWWTVQSIAFGVVLFTLLVQAPTIPWAVKKI